MKDDKDNLILRLTFQFSLDIIEFSELLEGQKKYVLARQLFKSGTSIGANVREAQSPERNADFVHKLKIAAKEAEEPGYWIRLCKFARSYPGPGTLLSDLNVIMRVLSRIISTSSGKRN